MRILKHSHKPRKEGKAYQSFVHLCNACLWKIADIPETDMCLLQRLTVNQHPMAHWWPHEIGFQNSSDAFFHLLLMNHEKSLITLILWMGRLKLPEVRSSAMIKVKWTLALDFSKFDVVEWILAAFRTLWSHVNTDRFKLSFPASHISWFGLGRLFV